MKPDIAEGYYELVKELQTAYRQAKTQMERKQEVSERMKGYLMALEFSKLIFEKFIDQYAKEDFDTPPPEEPKHERL